MKEYFNENRNKGVCITPFEGKDLFSAFAHVILWALTNSILTSESL